MRFVQVADGQPVRQVRLAPRERSILALLVRCYPDKQIAAVLNIQPRVVRNYLVRLSEGLDTSGRAELVRWTLLYPHVLAGAPAPVELHAEGCQCSASYCQAVALSYTAAVKSSLMKSQRASVKSCTTPKYFSVVVRDACPAAALPVTARLSSLSESHG